MGVKIAEMKIDDTRDNVSKEVRESFRQYRTALANEEISKQQVELAREAYALVEAAYMAGAGSSLEVTDAQRPDRGRVGLLDGIAAGTDSDGQPACGPWWKCRGTGELNGR